MCVCIVLSFNGKILAPIVYNLTGILSHAGNVSFFDYWLSKTITSYIQFLTQQQRQNLQTLILKNVQTYLSQEN